jgi:hypothetical protein
MVTDTRELRTHDGVQAGGYGAIKTKAQNDLLYQPMDADLSALAALASTGMLARIAANTYALRTLSASGAGLTITNGDGAAGNPTFTLGNDLAAIEALAGTGIAVRTATDTWAQRTLTAPSEGFTITNPAGVAGNPTFVLANDLGALEALTGTGIAVRTGTDTWAQRTITGAAAGVTVSNGSGAAGNPTLALADDLAALEGLGSTGFAVRSAASTWVQRSMANAAAGITWTNADGVSGNPTPVLANDLAALEGLGSTGIAVRTAADTWAQRTITGTGFTITNPGGVAGNIDLAYNFVALTNKASPVTGDIIPIGDSATSYSPKYSSVAQIILGQEPTKSTMQTASDGTTAVTPRRVNDNNGVAKAWAACTTVSGSVTVLDSHNCTIARVADGKYTATFPTPFASRNYAIFGTARRESGAGVDFGGVVVDKATAPTASVCTFITTDASFNQSQIAEFYVVFFGKQ